MPVIAHLQRRILEDANGNGGISTTAIALIVVLGILPCIVLIWAVCYLFWAYPYDRNCCCIKRKRRADKQDLIDQAAMSQDQMYQQSGMTPLPQPQRPFSEQNKTESRGSSGTGRLQKGGRPMSPRDKAATRMSLASVGSANTVQYTHEPKPFV
jgi:hypothetical protein